MEKTITNFNIDFSILPPGINTRMFSITGEDGAVFSLEVKDNTGKYYNFITNAFQTNKSGLLNKTISGVVYDGIIRFPAVPDSYVDRYDILLFAEPLTTKHADYSEVRFGDGSIDVNRSTGSNSLLMTKVLYQYPSLSLTLAPFSTQGAIEVGSLVTDTVAASAGSLASKQAFSISCAVTTASKCYRIIKQPTELDAVGFLALSIGSAPIKIPGENEYPEAIAAFAGDDINGAITSGAIVTVDADISSIIAVGDKLTTPTIETTEPITAVDSGTSILTLSGDVCGDLMAVGDRVTSDTLLTPFLLNNKVFTVKAIDVGGDTAKFEIQHEVDGSEANAVAAEIAGAGVKCRFSSLINRSLTTVTVVSTGGNNQRFTLSQDIQFRDNAPLTFFNQKNHRWPITNQAHLIKPGMKIITNTTNLTTDTTVADYLDTTTLWVGTEDEEELVNVSLPAIDTLGLKPTITNGLITTQAGQVIFDKQQKIALAGDALRIGGYGRREIMRLYGWDVVLTDLVIALTPVTTTTTGAVSNSTSVPVAERGGILDDVSAVSGIGIDASVVAPTVDTGAGAVTGAGTLVLTTAQTLESGITLAFANASKTATITGNIEILKVGNSSREISFDMEKLLSIT